MVRGSFQVDKGYPAERHLAEKRRKGKKRLKTGKGHLESGLLCKTPLLTPPPVSLYLSYSFYNRFVKFYAPWCKHCKELAPMWEEVANELKGEVNVAKVDVMANRDLGTRFDIKGFPMLLLLSKGHVYTFKGRRSQEELVDFARGGFQMHEPQKVRGELGLFGEIFLVYEHASKTAAQDIKNAKSIRDIFTLDIFITSLPVLFVLMLIVIFLLPMPQPPPRKKVIRKTRATDDGGAGGVKSE